MLLFFFVWLLQTSTAARRRWRAKERTRRPASGTAGSTSPCAPWPGYAALSPTSIRMRKCLRRVHAGRVCSAGVKTTLSAPRVPVRPFRAREPKRESFSPNLEMSPLKQFSDQSSFLPNHVKDVLHIS